MKIFLGADHRGFSLKEQIKQWLALEGYSIEDKGAVTHEPGDDYSDYAAAVARDVAQAEDHKGIVFCGSGIGVDVAANKVDGARSGYAASIEEIESARRDDNINILAVGADFVDFEQAKKFIQTFLSTEYTPTERYERRLHKIKELEEKN